MEMLRHSLGRLRRVAETLPAAADPGELAQEMLDFLAMQAGLKPVCLLGRGFDDAGWQAGVLKLAADLKLHVTEGPCWRPAAALDGLPPCYAARVRAALAGITVRYICRAEDIAGEVRAIASAGGDTSVAQEARLLNYPECCVADHHRREAAFHRATLAPDTAALQASMAVTPCPYTSFNMCPPCCADASRPAARLALEYAGLARRIDPALMDVLARTNADPLHQDLT